MEAIKGTDVNVPDAVFAWLLDGRGGVKPLEDNDVIDTQHPCWLHLNYIIKMQPAGMLSVDNIVIFQWFHPTTPIQQPGKHGIRHINIRSLNGFHSASTNIQLFSLV